MQRNLDQAFVQLGMGVNFTKAGGYQDQTGGYYSGGSLISRGKVNNTDLLSLQMPSYRAGCGGIDVHFGGMSFISKDQFIPMLRQISMGAVGYAFQLALATQTPQLKAVLDELAKTIQDAANMSINSCEMGATLVGGMWPQSDASSELLCGAMSKDLGIVSDWTEGRQKCAQHRSAINSRKNEREEYQSLLGDSYNLAWKAIQQNRFLKADAPLAEFFMTLSGTLISRMAGERHIVQYIPAASLDKELIRGMIFGQQPIAVQHCDDPAEDRCLMPVLSEVVLSSSQALLTRTNKILSSITEKVRGDIELSPEEAGFVDSTSLPILKILMIENAYKKGLGGLHINTYSEAIAYDILLQYLDEILSLVEHSLVHLKQSQMEERSIDQFRMGLMDSRHLIHEMRDSLFQQILVTLEVVERTLQIESKMQNAFVSSQQGSRVRR